MLLKRLFLTFLCLILLISMWAFAISMSLQATLSNQARLSQWLTQSIDYDHVINSITTSIPTTISLQVDGQTKDLKLSESEIKQAVKTAFSRKQFNLLVTQFVRVNYQWLEGKGSPSAFQANISAAANTVSAQLSSYVVGTVKQFPICTNQQLYAIAIGTNSLATTACIPPTIDTVAVKDNVSSQISQSTPLLSQVKTGTFLSGKGNVYDHQLKWVPSVYHFLHIAPFIFISFMVLSAIVILLLYRVKKGLRTLSVYILVSGVILLGLSLLLKESVDQLTRISFLKFSVDHSRFSFMRAAITAIEYALHLIYRYAVIYLMIGGVLLLISFMLKKSFGSARPKTPPLNKTGER